MDRLLDCHPVHFRPLRLQTIEMLLIENSIHDTRKKWQAYCSQRSKKIFESNFLNYQI